MLGSFVVEVVPHEDTVLPWTSGRLAHAVLFALLEQRDRPFSDRLHALERKPFTVSEFGGPHAEGRQTRLPAGEATWFRVTTLAREVTEVLLRPPDAPEAARLGRVEAEVRRVAADRRNPWGGLDSYADLFRRWATGEHPPAAELMLASPTTFNRTGPRDLSRVQFPAAADVFGGLVDRWQRYSPVPLPAEIAEAFADAVEVEACRDLASWRREFLFEDRDHPEPVTGVVGRVTYRVRRPEWSGVLHLLADYAFYAGVGYLTTMGLGQVAAPRRSERRQDDARGQWARSPGSGPAWHGSRETRGA